MFGGIAFMHRGHMLCGIHKNGGMFRVGKENEAEALKVRGAAPMTMTGRPMPGMVTAGTDFMADDPRRKMLLDLALAFNRSQKPK
jgi:hypothetical protein